MTRTPPEQPERSARPELPERPEPAEQLERPEPRLRLLPPLPPEEPVGDAAPRRHDPEEESTAARVSSILGRRRARARRRRFEGPGRPVS